TVTIAPDGRTTGYNTDRRGWHESFAESLGPMSARSATVVLVGAGGAGRAVAFALMDLGVATLVIHDVDRARANALQADISAPHAAASRMISRATSRAPTGSSTPRRSAWAAFQATRCLCPRLELRIGLPTSSILRSKPSSSKLRSQKAPACSTAAGCAFTKPSKRSDSLLA